MIHPSSHIRSLIISVFFIGAFFPSGPIMTQSRNPVDDLNIIVPEPRIQIPGLDFTEAEKIKASTRARYERDQKIILQIPYLAEYIAQGYKYLVGIASILAVIMIIVAGFQWSLSGGNTATIDAAKKKIGNATIGLTLAVTSYAILYAINPALVTFRSLSLQYVEGVPILPDGEPESASRATSVPYLVGALDETGCRQQLSALVEYANNQKTFGADSGWCLRWTKRAIEQACGSVPREFAVQDGAWDAAATLKTNGKFHACNLSGIQNGDIVFMTTLGSKWIGLWDNFRLGPDGCTIADAKAAKDIVIRLPNGGQKTNVAAVATNPRDMPPVTHVGIYYDGKVYHRTNRVDATSVETGKMVQASNRTKNVSNWSNIALTGTFIAHESTFIAGYVSLKDL